MVWVRRNLKNHAVSSPLPSYLIAGSAFFEECKDTYIQTYKRAMVLVFSCFGIWQPEGDKGVQRC